MTFSVAQEGSSKTRLVIAIGHRTGVQFARIVGESRTTFVHLGSLTAWKDPGALGPVSEEGCCSGKFSFTPAAIMDKVAVFLVISFVLGCNYSWALQSRPWKGAHRSFRSAAAGSLRSGAWWSRGKTTAGAFMPS